MNKILKIKCPQCETAFNYYESEFRPFCSERCKMVDLGHWFEESYKVPDKDKNNNVTTKEEAFSEEKNNSAIKEVEQDEYYGDEYSQIDSESDEENSY